MKRNSVRLALGASLVAAVLGSAASAEAQDFYDAGEISVALERVIGIHHQSWDVGDQDGSNTVIGIGWSRPATPLHVPRAALDGFIIDQLSLGGSIAFFSISGSEDADGVLFAPRVGYAIPLSRVFTFWPRGGFSYWDIEEGSQLSLSAEAMFVATVRPGWGILFGPTLDLGLSGKRGDTDYSDTSFALPTVGMMGTF